MYGIHFGSSSRLSSAVTTLFLWRTCCTYTSICYFMQLAPWDCVCFDLTFVAFIHSFIQPTDRGKKREGDPSGWGAELLWQISCSKNVNLRMPSYHCLDICKNYCRAWVVQCHPGLLPTLMMLRPVQKIAVGGVLWRNILIKWKICSSMQRSPWDGYFVTWHPTDRRAGEGKLEGDPRSGGPKGSLNTNPLSWHL